jgi:branched-chain amino acid transport system permease protein
VLTSLPELFRVFADYRNVVQGILLMLVIVYLPRGVADTVIGRWRDRRLRRARSAKDATPGAPEAPEASIPSVQAGAHP